MHIGFYLNNKRIPHCDFEQLSIGNPGIGGTPYIMALTSQLLAENFDDLKITIFLDIYKDFGGKIKVIVVSKGVGEAIRLADAMSYDFIIINMYDYNWNTLNRIEIVSQLKIIPWCHNIVPPSYYQIFSNNNKIYKVLNVGREQLDLMRDHSVFMKAEYIYNCVPKPKYSDLDLIPYEKRDKIVLYMGNIVWDKSFHILAKMWKQIINRVPEAKLFVIGDSYLYSTIKGGGNRENESIKYMKYCLSFLKNDDGKLFESVRFFGKQGLNKYNLLRQAKVGVPNPLGFGETFCISAVEMQYCGCAVTAIQSPGYMDTIYNGIISNNTFDLTRNIIKLLNDNHSPKTYKQTVEYLEQRFSPPVIIKEWKKLFYIDKFKHLNPILPINNPDYRLKYYKELLRVSKHKYLFLNIIPPLEWVLFSLSLIKNKISKILANM